MRDRGFSLIEILLALVMSISISLAILKQQWQIHRWRIVLQQQVHDYIERSNQRERGFTLLECLFGLALVVIILSLITQQYLNLKYCCAHMVQSMQHISRLQMVENLLRSSGHQAGFTPCLPLKYLHSFDPNSRQPLQAMVISPQSPQRVSFNHMSPTFVSLSPSASPNTFLFADDGISHSNPVLMIADCQHAELLSAYQLRGHSIQLSQILHFVYHPPLYLGEWVSESYWVAVNSHGQHALFYQQNQHVDEVVTDVQALNASLVITQVKQYLHLNLDLGQGDTLPLDIRLHHL